MTRSKFLLRDGLLVGFVLDGHVGAGDKGRDIVCAAVSSAAILTVNTITDVCKCRATIEDYDGHLSVRVQRGDRERCQDVLQGFWTHMRALQRQYPHFIEVTIWRCKRHAETQHPAFRS